MVREKNVGWRYTANGSRVNGHRYVAPNHVFCSDDSAYLRIVIVVEYQIQGVVVRAWCAYASSEGIFPERCLCDAEVVVTCLCTSAAACLYCLCGGAIFFFLCPQVLSLNGFKVFHGCQGCLCALREGPPASEPFGPASHEGSCAGANP